MVAATFPPLTFRFDSDFAGSAAAAIVCSRPYQRRRLLFPEAESVVCNSGRPAGTRKTVYFSLLNFFITCLTFPPLC